MEFSIGTTPQSTSPLATASSTSGTDGKATSSSPARSGCDRTACSVNVPNGPKNPTRRGMAPQAIGDRPPPPDRFGGADRAPWQHWCVDERTLRALLDDLAAGRVDADEVVRRLRRLPFADVGDALVDHHRALRQGLPEAVYGPGKTPEQCVRIVGELLAHGTGPVLLTRTSDDQAKAVVAQYGPALEQGGCLLYRAPEPARAGDVVVVAAGTADRPVADECLIALRAHGFVARRLDDVGVAGLHRLLA